MNQICLHATTIGLNGTAVLIRGPSGSGKSSLALQLLETSGTGLTEQPITATLVSDDQTELKKREGCIYASPPAALAGLIEVRGQGILTSAYLSDLPVVLVVDLKPASEIERLPENSEMIVEILGVAIKSVAIDPTHMSAPSRLRVAWAQAQKL